MKILLIAALAAATLMPVGVFAASYPDISHNNADTPSTAAQAMANAPTTAGPDGLGPRPGQSGYDPGPGPSTSHAYVPDPNGFDYAKWFKEHNPPVTPKCHHGNVNPACPQI